MPMPGAGTSPEPVRSCLDGKVVDPAEIGELVAILLSVLPDHTEDEARGKLCSAVVKGGKILACSADYDLV